MSKSTSKLTGVTYQILGFAVFCALWYAFTLVFQIPERTLPGPQHVLRGFATLYNEYKLNENLSISMTMNLVGYVEAVLFALPIGYAIGLSPTLNLMSERMLSVVRFLPLPLLTGPFIRWFGSSYLMKTQFLATAIFVYLLPTIVQRINEMDPILVQTAKTCGASRWQTIRHVIFPATISKIVLDIIVLVAISWTYINFVETINSGEGGLGAAAANASRANRTEVVFAILALIGMVGYLQDKILKYLHALVFPHVKGGTATPWYQRLFSFSQA